MKILAKIKELLINQIPFWILLGVGILCAVFILCGTPSENGSITLDGKDARIEDYTKEFIESANEALNRIMNEDAPTDEATILENINEEASGQGFYTTIDDILARVLPDGNNDGGKGWQCSKYTAYLGTGKREYSTIHPDYGPVNGKDLAAYLVKYYGFKYIDKPVKGAIGSGGFNTKYGHSALYLYATGTNTAVVNDANYTPLTVSTHEMNIEGWKWVVPGSYNPQPTPAPGPTPAPVVDCKIIKVAKGDTMSAIMKRCNGLVDWRSINNYADSWVSTLTGKSVYYGWTHGAGYGLIAGDTITYTGKVERTD